MSPDEEIKKLLIPLGHRERVPAGKTVIAEGDEDNDAFYVEQGRVKVVHITRDGHTAHLASYAAGQIFGYFACLTGGARTATVMADEETVLLRIPGAAAKREILSHPALKDQLMIAMTQTIIETQHKLIENASTPAEDRILSHLYALADDDGIVQTPRGWKTEQAEVLGMARENFSRHLSDLQRRGVITVYKDYIQYAV